MPRNRLFEAAEIVALVAFVGGLLYLAITLAAAAKTAVA